MLNISKTIAVDAPPDSGFIIISGNKSAFRLKILSMPVSLNSPEIIVIAKIYGKILSTVFNPFLMPSINNSYISFLSISAIEITTNTN